MKIIIHRGTHQIGGCVTEIQTKEARIMVDMGEELPNEDVPGLPIDIDGVTTVGEQCDAVFFTHNHGDHIGMFFRINKEIPLYLGEAAKAIYQTLQAHLKSPYLDRIDRIKTFQARDSIQIKDIIITPFLVDHSAYDAYMFLIEAEGKRILHTGDFRNHGYKGKGLFKTLEKYVGQVDVLITEGTTLSRNDQTVMSESELQVEAGRLLREKKYVFVLCSSTNIDRIAAFYHAKPRGRYFICDQYQKDVLQIVTEYGAQHSNLYSFDKVHTYGDNLLDRFKNQGFCMLVRNNPMFGNTMKKFDPQDCLVIYSMWKGYLSFSNNGLNVFLRGYNWKYLHTSGHATKETIHKVIEIVNPKIGVIPIHTEKPSGLRDLVNNVKVIFLNDGEGYEI